MEAEKELSIVDIEDILSFYDRLRIQLNKEIDSLTISQLKSNTKTILYTIRLKPSKLKEFKSAIYLKMLNSMLEPGRSYGITAAHANTAPIIQEVLNMASKGGSSGNRHDLVNVLECRGNTLLFHGKNGIDPKDPKALKSDWISFDMDINHNPPSYDYVYNYALGEITPLLGKLFTSEPVTKINGILTLNFNTIETLKVGLDPLTLHVRICNELGCNSNMSETKFDKNKITFYYSENNIYS